MSREGKGRGRGRGSVLDRLRGRLEKGVSTQEATEGTMAIAFSAQASGKDPTETFLMMIENCIKTNSVEDLRIAIDQGHLNNNRIFLQIPNSPKSLLHFINSKEMLDLFLSDKRGRFPSFMKALNINITLELYKNIIEKFLPEDFAKTYLTPNGENLLYLAASNIYDPGVFVYIAKKFPELILKN